MTVREWQVWVGVGVLALGIGLYVDPDATWADVGACVGAWALTLVAVSRYGRSDA